MRNLWNRFASVHLARLYGSNGRYIEKEIPHLSTLMTSSLSRLCRFAEVIVLGQRNSSWHKHVGAEHLIIDLVRISDRNDLNGSYRGICW